MDLKSAMVVWQDAIKTRKGKITASFVQLGLLVWERVIQIAQFVLRASTAPQMEAPCAYHARKVTIKVLTDRVNVTHVAAERGRG